MTIISDGKKNAYKLKTYQLCYNIYYIKRKKLIEFIYRQIFKCENFTYCIK